MNGRTRAPPRAHFPLPRRFRLSAPLIPDWRKCVCSPALAVSWRAYPSLFSGYLSSNRQIRQRANVRTQRLFDENLRKRVKRPMKDPPAECALNQAPIRYGRAVCRHHTCIPCIVRFFSHRKTLHSHAPHSLTLPHCCLACVLQSLQGVYAGLSYTPSRNRLHNCGCAVLHLHVLYLCPQSLHTNQSNF